jgi:tripartite-type tricarboxylate transporter receptor subunit TctC
MRKIRSNDGRRRRWFFGALLVICASTAHAQTQTYPNRTVRIVVPYAPGGGVSILAQIVGNKTSELTKQPVVIDNRPGAGGNLGADVVAKSPPDGYTILLHTSAHAATPSLYRSLPFDPLKDFVPVTMVISTGYVIGGSLKHPATTLRELAADAKARPGVLNYGSSGPGSALHLIAEMFKAIAGVDIVHIPYRGDAPMITALVANDIQLAFLPQANGVANVNGNLIRGLAVTGTGRMAALPHVSTAAEQGFSGLERGGWNGMFVPAGTPPDIVLAIQQIVARALTDPTVRHAILSSSQEPVGNSPAEFARQFKEEIDRLAKVIERANIPKLD